jgi:hypothetical protein
MILISLLGILWLPILRRQNEREGYRRDVVGVVGSE